MRGLFRIFDPWFHPDGHAANENGESESDHDDPFVDPDSVPMEVEAEAMWECGNVLCYHKVTPYTSMSVVLQGSASYNPKHGAGWACGPGPAGDTSVGDPSAGRGAAVAALARAGLATLVTDACAAKWNGQS